MPRQNTRLECEGAEFLVLGWLLIQGIPSYKTYTNMPAYDVVATNPEKNKLARISVKSRWTTGAAGFPIKNFDCDFVVLAKLNRGDKRGRLEVKDPEYFVFPTAVLRDVPRDGWSRMELKNIPQFEDYQDKWDLIRDFLGVKPSNREIILNDEE